MRVTAVTDVGMQDLARIYSHAGSRLLIDLCFCDCRSVQDTDDAERVLALVLKPCAAICVLPAEPAGV
jgi:hypothetical protein